MSVIIAKKGTQIKEFTELQWKSMPKNKYGWTLHIPEKGSIKPSGSSSEDKGSEKKSAAPASPVSPKSTDEGVNVGEAVAVIKTLTSKEGIDQYTEGDDRTTVTTAVAKRLEELSAESKEESK